MGGSLSPTPSKLKPARRLNSPTLKLAQRQRADQAGWRRDVLGEKRVGVMWQVDLVTRDDKVDLVTRDDVAEIAGREGVQFP